MNHRMSKWFTTGVVLKEQWRSLYRYWGTSSRYCLLYYDQSHLFDLMKSIVERKPIPMCATQDSTTEQIKASRRDICSFPKVPVWYDANQRGLSKILLVLAVTMSERWIQQRYHRIQDSHTKSRTMTYSRKANKKQHGIVMNQTDTRGQSGDGSEVDLNNRLSGSSNHKQAKQGSH